jgi:putative transposase
MEYIYNYGVTRYARNTSAVFSLEVSLGLVSEVPQANSHGGGGRAFESLAVEKANEFSLTIHTMEIMPDHVHLLIESDPTFRSLRSPIGSKVTPAAF